VSALETRHNKALYNSPSLLYFTFLLFILQTITTITKQLKQVIFEFLVHNLRFTCNMRHNKMLSYRRETALQGAL